MRYHVGCVAPDHACEELHLQLVAAIIDPRDGGVPDQCRDLPARTTDEMDLVRHVLVDSAAEMTWIPEATPRSMGVDIFKRDQVFVMATGQEVTRDVGIAVIRSGEFKTVDEIVFGRPGDLSLLGARTLEGFNASVDSRRRRLVAAGPILAARSLGRR